MKGVRILPSDGIEEPERPAGAALTRSDSCFWCTDWVTIRSILDILHEFSVLFNRHDPVRDVDFSKAGRAARRSTALSWATFKIWQAPIELLPDS